MKAATWSAYDGLIHCYEPFDLAAEDTAPKVATTCCDIQIMHGMPDQVFCANARVYVHCTAGLGRAPAVIIAYLFWFKDMGLDEVICLTTWLQMSTNKCVMSA